MRRVDTINRNIFAGLLLCCVFAVSGCAQTAPPTSGEVAAAQQGGQMLVLLRVVTKSSTGDSIKPFANSFVDDNIGVAVGSFETGGKVRRIEDMRFLSDESRADGRFFAVLPPGTNYFSFLPPRRTNIFSYLEMFNHAKLWRIDVPKAKAMVYGGSLFVEGDAGSLLFGSKYIKNLRRMEVRDETVIAKNLVQRFMPGISGIKTTLMVAHEGPIILTTPTN